MSDDDTDYFNEVSTLINDTSETAKKIYQGLNEEKKKWFASWRQRVESKSKDSMYYHLGTLLKSASPPIQKYPKPVRSMLYFAIKKMPLKLILGDSYLWDWTQAKTKSQLSSKRKSSYRLYRKYNRRSSFGSRKYSRRSSYIPNRRSSYSRRSSIGFRRYSRRNSFGSRRYSRRGSYYR